MPNPALNFRVRTASRGFTLVELLVALVVIAFLSGLSMAALGKMRSVSQGAVCANSLRQFGVAAQMYLADHRSVFFRYKKTVDGEGVTWYFGFEPESNAGKAEGERELDLTAGPLYPYITMAGGIEVCPAFSYDTALAKPKFKGASFGFGFNTLLSNVNALTLQSPSKVIVFGDCAQVNTHQAPASPSNPMLEEFYMINQVEVSIHFRHQNRAQFVFADGHVESLAMFPGTLDPRLRSVNVGRISPSGSLEYLK